MKKLFINSLFDIKYISIYLIGIIMLYFSYEPLYNLVLDFLSNTMETFKVVDLFKNTIFPISLDNISILFFSVSRELISFIILFYPIVKIIDMFLNYSSTILFTKIERKDWVKSVFKIIIFYILISFFIIFIVDIIGLYVQTKVILPFKNLLTVFVIKYLTLMISVTLFSYFSIKMNELYFGTIASTLIYIIMSIIINNVFLDFLTSFFVITYILLSICCIFIIHKNNLININSKDLGGV